MNKADNNWCASLHQTNDIYCDNYLSGDKQFFETYVLRTGLKVEKEDIGRNTICCVLSGKLEISTGGAVCQPFEAGQMLLLPAGDNINARVISECTIVCCAFNNEMSACGRYFIDCLINHKPSQEVSPKSDEQVFMMPIHELIMRELHIIREMVLSGKACIYYQRLKKDVLFIEMRGLYSMDDLYRFLSPIIGKDVDFKYRVLELYQQVETAQELNELLNMSATTFKQKFRETFGTTARKWLIKKKEQKIIRDILMTDMTAVELADKYNYTANYMTTFCRRRFGKSLSELRLSHSGGVISEFRPLLSVHYCSLYGLCCRLC